jgi:hypothetical protein
MQRGDRFRVLQNQQSVRFKGNHECLLGQGLIFRAYPCKMNHSLGDFPVIRGAMGWLEAVHESQRRRRSCNSLFAKFRLNSKRSRLA